MESPNKQNRQKIKVAVPSKQPLQDLYRQNNFGIDQVTQLQPMVYKKTSSALNSKTSDKDSSPESPIASNTSNTQGLAAASGEWNPRYSSASDAFFCPDLATLRQKITQFEQCSLKKLAINTVFSDGNSNAKVMLIGEAPGEEEDKQGKPFVGKSGKLLDNILARLNLTREYNIYISNVLPWRPPGNRTPTPEEVKICLPFLLRHIELINPKVIVLVGGVAMNAILPAIKVVSQGRKRWHKLNIEALKNTYRVRPIDISSSVLFDCMVAYHPSYLLRSPTQKIHAWYDMLMLQQKIADLA